jgi:hypothetical protein
VHIEQKGHFGTNFEPKMEKKLVFIRRLLVCVYKIHTLQMTVSSDGGGKERTSITATADGSVLTALRT